MAIEQDKYGWESGRFREEEEYTSVLSNLQDIHGQKVGLKLVDRVISERKRLILMGEASGGKTTLIANFAYALNKRSAKIESFVFYDQVLREIEDLIKEEYPEKTTRDKWTEDDWSLLDDALFGTMEATAGKRALIEVPGVSKQHGIRTRGKNAIKELASVSDDILLAYNVADPSTQVWGAYVRETLLSTPDDEVFKVMRDQFNQEVTGIVETTKLGARLKTAIKWSAAREHIDAIDIEMMEMARKWELEGDNSEKANSIKLKVQDAYPFKVILGEDNTEVTANQAGLWAESATRKIKLKAAFAEHYVHEVLGLDESNFVVVFNPFKANLKIKVDASVFGIR